MVTKLDRPANPTMRTWQVKFRGLDDPVEVEAEYRAAARHYAKSYVERQFKHKGEHYPQVEWCRLKRD